MRKFIVFIFIFFGLVPSVNAGVNDLKDRIYDNYGIDLAGYLETGAGWRLRNDPHEKQTSLAEATMLLDVSRYFDWGAFKANGYVVADGVMDDVSAELRECAISFSPLPNMDLKLGRQVITWGTGDMVFINDLFPKDWQSFFIGRDDEFLKGSTDGIRASLFFDALNIDAVFVPVEVSSIHVSGERLSYWNGRMAGRDNRPAVEDRSSFGRDSEYAVRVYRNIKSIEAALYAYSGFWKTPEGVNAGDSSLFYPRLSVYGGSIRGPLAGGIGHLEMGYYDSREDSDGSRPFIRNNEFRFVAGLERELGRDFTGSIQYYLEWMMEHDTYERTMPPGTPVKDEYRHVLTLRLTKLLLNQNLILSFFGYYSPSDTDGYLRPKVQYKLTDQWFLETGVNFFFGSDDYTFFAQFKDNSNIYARVRWRF